MVDATRFEETVGESGGFDALLSRIEKLEAILKNLDHIEECKIDLLAARSAQSIGVVVEFLADRGLIDKRELLKYISKNFKIVEKHETGDNPHAYIDIYGWLIWADISKTRRDPARILDAVFNIFDHPKTQDRDLAGESEL